MSLAAAQRFCRPLYQMEFSLSVTPVHIKATVEKAQQITQSLYMDRRTTAAFMGMSEKFLATHLTDGPRRLRVGSKIVYRLSDVEEWMRQQEISR